MARINVGQIASAIESGKRAAASIDHGPILDSASVNITNNRFVADWQNSNGDKDTFIFGVHKWADQTLKVAK